MTVQVRGSHAGIEEEVLVSFSGVYAVMRSCGRIGLNGDMFLNVVPSLLVILLSSSWLCQATELMFELPDRDRQCFYEVIIKGISSTLEYQVRCNYGVGGMFLIKVHQ